MMENRFLRNKLQLSRAIWIVPKLWELVNPEPENIQITGQYSILFPDGRTLDSFARLPCIFLFYKPFSDHRTILGPFAGREGANGHLQCQT